VGHEHTHHPHGPHHHDQKGLRTAFLLNLVFTGVEAAGGVFTGSIAVLSDALHDLGDCLVLGTAWYLQRLASRGRDERYSYGYARFSMLGGWLAAAVLAAGSIAMLAVTLPRFRAPGEPHAIGMMALAVFGMVMNGLAVRQLKGASLNERGARLHLMEDVMGWAAVLLGGALIWATGRTWIDPLLSVGISLYILYGALRTLRDGTAILMQSQPAAADAPAIDRALRALPNVVDVHDQHVWSLDGSYMVLTVHLVVDDLSAAGRNGVKQRARDLLAAMHIDHATIELEITGEECSLRHH
jgi:cobalt-zinc-cadmium efflux system protein